MNKPLKVMQVIDSLFAGGSERMSVNLSNSLAEIDNVESYLCATRHGGALESAIDKNVEWMILDKKKTFDFKAFYRFISYVKKNEIDIIHAHSSSYFIALIAKMFTNVKVVWHIHYGKLAHQNPSKIMHFLSKFVDYTIVVNKELLQWSIEKLGIKSSRVKYIANFPALTLNDKLLDLPGIDGKRIVCVGNIRDEKDHLNLCKAMSIVSKVYPKYSLLIIGEDYKDDYSEQLHTLIENENLINVHLLGARKDIADILNACDIAVISSKIEGLPVVLLEYGLAKLPVVTTDVGECANVVQQGEVGLLIPKENEQALADALVKLIQNDTLRQELAKKFHNVILKEYSKESIMKTYLNIYEQLI